MKIEFQADPELRAVIQREADRRGVAFSVVAREMMEGGRQAYFQTEAGRRRDSKMVRDMTSTAFLANLAFLLAGFWWFA